VSTSVSAITDDFKSFIGLGSPLDDKFLGPNIAQTRVLFNGIAGLTQGFSKVSPTVTLSEAKGDNQ
jgi:hypothetical protein